MAYEELKAANARRKGMSESDAAKESMKAPKGDGLVDMKLSKKKRKEMATPSVEQMDRYPYGLELRLDNEAMEKLGLGLPTVGKEVTITAKAKVQSAESRDGESDGKRLSCCLQIVKMKVS